MFKSRTIRTRLRKKKNYGGISGAKLATTEIYDLTRGGTTKYVCAWGKFPLAHASVEAGEFIPVKVGFACSDRGLTGCGQAGINRDDSTCHSFILEMLDDGFDACASAVAAHPLTCLELEGEAGKFQALTGQNP